MSLSDVLVSLLLGLCKTFLLASALLFLRAMFWLINLVLVLPLSDHLRRLPGPDGVRFQNHFQEVMDPEVTPDVYGSWMKAYGKTFRFHGFGKHDYRLMSFDFRVITHVLSSPIYEKPWQTQSFLSRLIGRGIFSVEGQEHKLHRRILGPAFNAQSIQSMTPVFFRKAEELCNRWDLLASENTMLSTSKPVEIVEGKHMESSDESLWTNIDVSHWLSRASFDVIGLAGFDYHFRALEDETEAMYAAYRNMFATADKGMGLRGLLDLYFPILIKLCPDKNSQIINKSLQVINKAGKILVAKKKGKIMANTKDARAVEEKDILSLLIKSNLSNDPLKRLSDSELLDQCSTLLLAGSDTVSLALSWCLHLLSKHPTIQERLRREIVLVSNAFHTSDDSDYSDSSTDSGFAEFTETPGLDQSSPTKRGIRAYSRSACQIRWQALDNLAYLDAVVRETLRFCPPVHGTIRVATADDRIPISNPVILRDGTVENEYISIRKGSYIHIPIEGLNYSDDVWGGDAKVFNPDRWEKLPSAACSPSHPGLGNLMTFGFGPHSCLGYKFSIAEIKIFLATILPRFVFAPATGIEISKFNSIVTRPYVVDKRELGTQLPIAVKVFRS